VALNAAKGISRRRHYYQCFSVSVPSFTEPTDRPEIYILLRIGSLWIGIVSLLTWHWSLFKEWNVHVGQTRDNGYGPLSDLCMWFHSIRLDLIRFDSPRLAASASASASRRLENTRCYKVANRLGHNCTIF